MNHKYEGEIEITDIKPIAKKEDIKIILEKHYGIKETAILQLNGYDDLNFLCNVKTVTGNPNLKISQTGNSFVLKIMNSLDSKKNMLCDAQNSIMLFFEKQGNIPCPVPVMNVFGEYYSKEKLPLSCEKKETKKEHVIRLLKYIPGTPVKEVKKNYSLFKELGIALAHFNQVLEKFDHPFYQTHTSIWHLRSAPELKIILHIITDSEKRNLVELIVNRFCDEIIPKEKTLEQGIIHGDFNEHNVLVSEREDKGKTFFKVAGILDFGDTHYSCYLFEAAIAICYIMFEAKRQNLHPVTAAGHFLAGYFKFRSFDWDFGALKLCVCTRICQSLVLGLKAFQLNPVNHYVLDSQSIGWPLLEELYHIPDQHLTAQLKSVISNCTS